MRHPRAIVRAGLGLTVIIALAACSGNDTQGSAAALANSIAAAADSAAAAAASLSDALPTELSTDGADYSEPAVETSETAAAAPPVTREIGKTGWYDGFAVTVDEVTAEPGYGTDVDMTVKLTFENLGIDENSPPQGNVEADGLAVDAFFDAPGIPAGGKAKGTATFSVQPDAAMTPDEAIDSVTIVYGDTQDNQTMLPLAKSGEVDSIEPKDLAVTGTLKQGDIVVDVVSATLAPSYESGEKGKALLDVRIKLTCAPGCSAGGWNTGLEQFSVTDPEGSSVVADQRSDYCCDALYPETVSDSERNILTFVVPLPGDGDYTLTYDNENISTTGVAPGTLAFSAT